MIYMYIYLFYYIKDYFVFVNALEGTLVLRKSLDYEIFTNFSVGIRAQVSVISIKSMIRIWHNGTDIRA